jgi:hypothetical protein
MQFCWLQPDQRPNAEEVHLLLSYLCAKGANEAEEDFERRWNSLRPNPNAGPNNSLHHGAGALAIGTFTTLFIAPVYFALCFIVCFCFKIKYKSAHCSFQEHFSSEKYTVLK